MSLIFKRCVIDDLDLLIQISRKTFIDAFEKDNNPSDFKQYVSEAFSKAQMLKELRDPNALFYFMVNESKGLVGYAKLNIKEAQNESFDLNAIELQRIYVLREFQGNEFGKEALELVIEIAQMQKASCVWLGVWEHNTRAIAFYQKHGFVKFDEHPYLIGEDEQYDWMMKLELVKNA